MLAATIKAYLFRQYAFDQNLQAYIDAYNAGTQELFIDWFNSVNLPVYTGLTGPLLYWVANGLYGMQFAALESPVSPAKGAYNTVPYNALAYNGSLPSSQTVYGVSDDMFKRIMTWNLYKGDGKRFCVRWLKRRIMRFLLGTNGVDPQPYNGFAVGCENTTPVSVSVVNEVLTVKIFAAALAALGVPLAPNVTTIFSAAFLSGVLDLPLRYTYVVALD